MTHAYALVTEAIFLFCVDESEPAILSDYPLFIIHMGANQASGQYDGGASLMLMRSDSKFSFLFGV